jgi:outer membrane immunogenic protein
MKNFVIGTALAALALAATPVMAGDFTGPRFEVTTGVDDVTSGVDATDIAYGAALGYDLQLKNKLVVGVEAAAGNVFDKREIDLSVAARVGYVLNKNVLAFGRVGLTNLERPQTCTGTRTVVCRATKNAEGITVGGGVEVAVAGPFYGKAEYRYTDFDGKLARQGATVGVGLRF